MTNFNRHDAEAGHCDPLDINTETRSEHAQRLTRNGIAQLTEAEMQAVFPEGDGPIRPAATTPPPANTSVNCESSVGKTE